MAETRLLSWDWREQPDCAELARILADLTDGRIHVADVDTRDDQFAWVLSTEPITAAEATEVYRRRWDDEDEA